MKRKTISHAKVIILLCIALLMFNCQNDENSSNELQNKIETVNIDEAKNFLMHSKNNFSAKSTNNELEDLAFDKITQEKIKGSDQLLTVIPFATNSDLEYKRILLLKIDNKIKSVVFSMYSDENSIKGSFSGNLFAYSLEGVFINGFRAEDGVIVSQFFENNASLRTNTKNDTFPTLTRKSAVQLSGVTVYQKKTVHALDMFGVDGMFDDFDSSTPYYSWDAGGGGNSGITAPTPLEIANALEKNINGTELDACSKAVLEKLKNLKQNDIADIISKFASNSSIFTLNMKTGKVETSTNDAETSIVSTYNYNITLNTNYINGVMEGEINSPPTTLSLATTLTHEIIHAYFISVVDEYKTFNSSKICDFPTLYDAYVMQNTPKGSSQSQVEAHHNLMATKYVNSIASTIQEFDTGIPVTSGFPNQVYLDIAWAGLEGTYIFNKNYPNDPNDKNYSDRNRILSRGSIEKYNKPRGNQIPIGKPCN